MANDKSVTNEELAQMVAKGFENTATKQDLNNVEERLSSRIDGVEGCLDRIENFMNGYGNRIEKLEDDMRQVKTKLELR